MLPRGKRGEQKGRCCVSTGVGSPSGAGGLAGKAGMRFWAQLETKNHPDPKHRL